MKRYTKGFTLIELLVVIAIIGILASVVLVSLNSARKKGSDTRVISSVNQLRTQIESDFNVNYGASFTAAGAIETTGNYAILTSDITTNGSTLTVATTGTDPNISAYALYGQLVSDTTKYFCVDSLGKTNPKASLATPPAATCPN